MAEHLDSEYTVTLDARRWSDEALLHDDFAHALDLPDHYGRNLDALFDCLREVVSGGEGASRGLTLVIHHFGTLAQSDPNAAARLRSLFDDIAELGAPDRFAVLMHDSTPVPRTEDREN